jgi:hypothetical protein
MSAVLAFAAMTLLTGHAAHVLEPTCVLNVSEPQGTHAFASPEKPTSHAHCSLPVPDTLFAGQDRHALMLVAAKLAENLLPGQVVHSEVPGTVLYVPTGHLSHHCGQVFVSTSVPCTWISLNVTWLAIEFRTCR